MKNTLLISMESQKPSLRHVSVRIHKRVGLVGEGPWEQSTFWSGPFTYVSNLTHDDAQSIQFIRQLGLGVGGGVGPVRLSVQWWPPVHSCNLWLQFTCLSSSNSRTHFRVWKHLGQKYKGKNIISFHYKENPHAPTEKYVKKGLFYQFKCSSHPKG